MCVIYKTKRKYAYSFVSVEAKCPRPDPQLSAKCTEGAKPSHHDSEMSICLVCNVCTSSLHRPSLKLVFSLQSESMSSHYRVECPHCQWVSMVGFWFLRQNVPTSLPPPDQTFYVFCIFVTLFYFPIDRFCFLFFLHVGPAVQGFGIH